MSSLLHFIWNSIKSNKKLVPQGSRQVPLPARTYPRGEQSKNQKKSHGIKIPWDYYKKNGARDWIRTSDLYRVKVAF